MHTLWRRAPGRASLAIAVCLALPLARCGSGKRASPSSKSTSTDGSGAGAVTGTGGDPGGGSGAGGNGAGNGGRGGNGSTIGSGGSGGVGANGPIASAGAGGDGELGSCDDMRKNGDELGIDCGGSCDPCVPASSDVPFLAGLSSPVGVPPGTDWEVLDLNGDGELDVVVDASSKRTALGNGKGVFLNAEYVGITEFAPLTLFGHADFDGDDHQDVLGCFGNNGVVVARGSGDTPNAIATSGPDFAFQPSGYLGYCATADFDGDNRPDVAVTTAAGIEIALNTGSALEAGEVLAQPTNIGELLVGDVDGDLVPDLLVGGNGAMSVFLSQGDGTFSAEVPNVLPDWTTAVELWPGPEPTLLLVGDEIAVAALAADGTVGEVEGVSGDNHLWATIGDLDNDDVPEVVAIDIARRVLVYVRVEQEWTLDQEYRTTWLASHPRLADFDRDGWLDIGLLAGTGDATVDVLLNQGDGTFPDPPEWGRDAEPVNTGKFADLNGDGRMDALVPHDSVPNQAYLDTYLSEAGGGFTRAAHVDITNRATLLEVGDFTGTAAPDVVLLQGGSLRPLVGDGDGGLSLETGFFGMNDTSRLLLADVSGNGVDDLLVGNPSGVQVRSAANGFFSETPAFETSDYRFVVGAVDVDDDGLRDLVVNAPAAWLRSLGDDAFEAPVPIGFSSALVALLLEGGAVNRRWLVGNVDGLYELRESAAGTTVIPLGGPRVSRAMLVDWNHDGVLDVLTGGSGVALYEGHEDGSFSFSEITLLAGGSTIDLAYFDATGDGLEDIVTISYHGAITVLPGLP